MPLNSLFQQVTGNNPTKTEPLTAAGSNRRYYRLQGDKISHIGVIGTSREENEAFLYMANHFLQKGIRVPKVFAVSDDHMAYLQEDLGSTLLFDYIAQGRNSGNFSEQEKQMLRKTMRQLAVLQVRGAEGFDYNVCYPQAAFNRRGILWDLNYFKYCFLKSTGLDFLEERLEDDFERLADILLLSPADTFMYRDFQSRNVMVAEGEPYFIDFQGGRRGPYYYDVASFLWQAKACFSPELRHELAEEYIDELSHYLPVDRQKFYAELHHFVLFRTLQVLGAYGFRGYFERKTHFIESIPFAMANLRELLKQPHPQYPYLHEVLDRLQKMERFNRQADPHPLLVRVYSFSYKKGIPEDETGNGGGYVFDCRATHNPGRYDAYKRLTGLDQPVIDFLEKDGEILTFLRHCHALVDATIERYLERGFTDLQVSFGCTGGQHRSVYSAEKTAEHLHEKYGIDVKIIHREQAKTRLLARKQSETK